MTCDGTGKAPCEGCPECAPVDDAAERAARHAELTAWYEAKVGTAPPRAKAAKGEAKAETDRQGRMF